MSDDKLQDDDEDLMSDFKDLFPDEGEEAAPDGASAAAEVADPSVALDELDAFLDDFENGLTPGEGNEAGDEDDSEETAEPPLLTDELEDAAPAAAERDTASELQLDREELDLAMSAAVADEDEDEDEDEVTDTEVEIGAQREIPLEEEPEVVPLAGSDEVAAAAPAAATPTTGEGGTAMSRTMQWSMISVMVVALVLSATAAWLAFSTASEVDAVARSVQALQQQQMAKGQYDTPAMSAMRTELRTLAARVNELAVVIEGPMSHLRQSNEDTLGELEKRLARLEAAGATRPMVEKNTARAAPAHASPAHASSKASAGAGWVINLISLSSEADAGAELKRLRSLGVRAEKQRAEKDGKVWYRLRVPGFTSYEGAKAYIETIEKKTGVKNAWVAKE